MMFYFIQDTEKNAEARLMVVNPHQFVDVAVMGIFGIILSRSKNPLAMKKNGIRNFKGRQTVLSMTNKAAIHPIVRKSPLFS
ncbi:hypothetical protein RP319_12710 [Heyndrickxia coagulans]|uniref:hypothetical protein n=2 Tax=Heyndrickxia TaxID=2837504 RepID=UPI0028F88BA7|nr:hypothetical protein [Heyndrickxia coagulans]MDT9756979.1 hypothetical protein [Heyndrickxia coagulans]